MGFDTYIRFALALVLVIGLIALIGWLLRRFGIAGRIAPGSGVPSGRRRLSVIEACTVDAKRRLVLVRRDGVEHLIMLTANGSGVVVERGIGEDAEAAKDFPATLARVRRRAKKTQHADLEAEDDERVDEAPERLPRPGGGGFQP